ncbi:MAG: hypothetical protein HGB26_00480 [Desulfobulbaceae bacterium]|nr:hypothetical protein [Desulfobulbaceae bacterium]
MAKRSNSNSSFKIEERFGPISLVVAVLGLVLGVLESVLKLITFVESNFYLSMALLWLLSLAFSRYYPSQGLPHFSVKRKWIVIFATILFIFSVSFTYYDRRYRVTVPAKPPEIHLTWLLGVSSASASQQTLKLTSFYLNEDLCSFEERKEPLFAAGPIVKTFSVNHDVRAAFKNGTCAGVDGDRPMIAAGSAIRKWIAKTERSNLLGYLEEPKALGRLAKKRGDIFEKIIPSSDELAIIKQQNPPDYEVIKKWILNCVGVYQPVFTVTLTNSGKQAIDITEVQYDIKEVGEVRGPGPGGPVWPELTFDHTLVHSKGVQAFPLKPVFNIPAGSTKAFNLRLHTIDQSPGLGWYLRIKFLDSRGNIATTERFQIFLNPK